MNVVKRSEYCGEKRVMESGPSRVSIASIERQTIFSGRIVFGGGMLSDPGVFIKGPFDHVTRISGNDHCGEDYNQHKLIEDYKELNVTLVIEDC